MSVPLGASPIINVTLGEKGGTASCTLTARGKHVQRATATGAFGRTRCKAVVPPISRSRELIEVFSVTCRLRCMTGCECPLTI